MWLVTNRLVVGGEQRSLSGGRVKFSRNYRSCVCGVKHCAEASKARPPAFESSGQTESSLCSHWLPFPTKPE